MDIGHEELAGYRIEHTDAYKQQTGTKKAHDHVFGRRNKGVTIIPYHYKGTGRHCVYLDKYVGRKKVIGIDKRKEGCHHEVYHDEIEVHLILSDIIILTADTSYDRQKHDNGEKYSHETFQTAGTKLVAPGSRELAHNIYEGMSQIYRISQNEAA